jgi:hypothetical protein
MTDRAAHRAEPRMIYRWFSVDGWATRIEFRDRDQRVYLMIATRTDGYESALSNRCTNRWH